MSVAVLTRSTADPAPGAAAAVVVLMLSTVGGPVVVVPSGATDGNAGKVVVVMLSGATDGNAGKVVVVMLSVEPDGNAGKVVVVLSTAAAVVEVVVVAAAPRSYRPSATRHRSHTRELRLPAPRGTTGSSCRRTSRCRLSSLPR